MRAQDEVALRRRMAWPLASTSRGVHRRPAISVLRYHKIGHDAAAIEGLFVDLFLKAHRRAPQEIILDLDATDDPLHGTQEGRFFHGYYDGYCYLPLYIYCGRHLLVAKLRRSDIDASAGALEEIERAVTGDPRALAEGADRFAGGLRFCPRAADEVVRERRRGLCFQPRAQRPATARARPRPAASEGDRAT
jgi:hypothetical protein